jgi:hypothetical protein
MLPIRRRLKPGGAPVGSFGGRTSASPACPNGEPSMNLPSQKSPIPNEKKSGHRDIRTRKPNDRFSFFKLAALVR